MSVPTKMPTRSLYVHGALLTLALVVSYFVWTRTPSTGAEDEVTIVNMRPGPDRVVQVSDDRTVTIERRKDSTGSYSWVKVETWVEPPPETPPPPHEKPARADGGKPGEPGKPGEAGKTTDGGAPATAAKGPDAGPAKPAPAVAEKPKNREKVKKIQEFRGGKGIDELLKLLMSFTAVRSLGTVDKEKDKAFGLVESKKQLTLTTGSSSRTFKVGGTTFGNMDLYIKDAQDGRVYVIRPRLLQDLQYAELRLMARELHDFEAQDVERVVISAKGKKKAIVQRNVKDPGGAFWADEDTPEKKKEIYKNWMEKVSGLQILEYLKEKDQPVGLKPVLELDYSGRGRALGHLTLLRIDPPAGTTPKGNQAFGEFYARSEASRVLTKLQRAQAEEAARDIDAILKE
jgi:hypothetical protein